MPHLRRSWTQRLARRSAALVLVDSLSRTLAERDAIGGSLAANRALTQHRQAIVEVYRALGGGWD